MTRRDWLTLFIALEGAPDGLDPVRIQKGMFLFAMQADIPTPEKYGFKPYDYGPMSAGIYADLDSLVGGGLAAREPVEGKTWARFRPTDAGLSAGRQALAQAEVEGQIGSAHVLQTVKQRVAGLPFNELLEDVYRDYPEYAVKSVFRRIA